MTYLFLGKVTKFQEITFSRFGAMLQNFRGGGSMPQS